MTSKSESQLMQEILDELDTLGGKFLQQDASLAALLVTLDTLATANNTELGTPAVNMAAILATLSTEASTMLTASA